MPFSIFAQGAWQSKAPLPTPRTEVAVAELNGKIYIFGGFLANGAATSVVEVYGVAADRWPSAASLRKALILFLLYLIFYITWKLSLAKFHL